MLHAVQVGGVTVQEVNRLELELLKLLEYRLWVPWEDMRPVLKSLLQAKLVLGQGEVRVVRAPQRACVRLARPCGWLGVGRRRRTSCVPAR